MTSLGGIEGVISPEPEVTIYPIDQDLDYALIACDGIFDVITNEEVNNVIWETVGYYKENQHTISDAYTNCLCDCVNNVLKKCLLTQSEDNVTVILVTFKDLFNC
jgi:serine/threonine protein phosphatase PrpC